jgi:uncharacterized membrane protein
MINKNVIKNNFFLFTLVLSSIGIISMVLSIMVYASIGNVSNICTLNSYVSCKKVDSSSYGSLFVHMPNGLFATILFVLVFLFSYMYIRFKKLIFLIINVTLLLVASIIGIYLLNVELNLIHGICILCMISFISILLLIFINYREIDKAIS